MINGKRVGHYGDYSTMSFQYNKMITAGEGGAVMMNDQKSHEKCVRFHNLGMDRKVGEDPTKTNDPVGPDSIVSVGLNYRMSEVTASIALAPFSNAFIAASFASIPCLHVEITIGNPCSERLFLLIVLVIDLKLLGSNIAPKAPIVEFFKNFLL